jgi:hypothetical protein
MRKPTLNERESWLSCRAILLIFTILSGTTITGFLFFHALNRYELSLLLVCRSAANCIQFYLFKRSEANHSAEIQGSTVENSTHRVYMSSQDLHYELLFVAIVLIVIARFVGAARLCELYSTGESRFDYG